MKRSRRGRPRKALKRREPSGRLSRQMEVRENEAHARWQRRHLRPLVGKDDLLTPEAGYPLGLLFINGRIAREHFEAGCRLRQIIHTWRRMQSLPRPSPKVARLSEWIGGLIEDASIEDEAKIEGLERAIGLSRKAVSSGRYLGDSHWKAVVGLCADDEEIPRRRINSVHESLYRLHCLYSGRGVKALLRGN
jgi:hypothetical protein